MNAKYVNKIAEHISMSGEYFDIFFDDKEKIFSPYSGKYFDKIKFTGVEVSKNDQEKLTISEFGFNNFDFKKFQTIKKLINSSTVSNKEKNNLSLILSMTFDKLYFKDINFKSGNNFLLSEYLEISDWNGLSFEKILVNNFIFQENNNQQSFKKLLIEDYNIDENAIISLLNSGYDINYFGGGYSQLLNSFKSLENWEINNYKAIENNKKLFSFEHAQISDVNFDYFGGSGDIKVPTSLYLKVKGTDFNSNNLGKNFRNMFDDVGYSSVKFDFASELKWNTTRNNIYLNLDFGITNAALLKLSANFIDFNTDVLTLTGAPLTTYLLTNPKLKNFNFSLVDDSLKDKLIAYVSKEENMTPSQYKDFLTQSLDIYATTFGIDQNLAIEMKKAVVNFINRSNKISIIINPPEPISITELMPDFLSQNTGNIVSKLNLKIKN